MAISRNSSFSIDGDTGRFMPSEPSPDISGHVVFLNANEKLPKIIEEIQFASKDDRLKIIVIVQDWDLWLENKHWHPKSLCPQNIYYREGRAAKVQDLRAARVDFARVAVVLADPLHGDLADAHTTLTAMAIEKLNADVHTIVELISSVNRVHLKFTKVNEVVCISELTEQLIAQSCISPGIKKVFEHLLSTDHHTMQVFAVPVPKSHLGKTYRELVRSAIQKHPPLIVYGFSRISGDPLPNRSARRTIVLNPRSFEEPGKDTVLNSDDMLIVAAYKRPDLEKLL
jgi:Trk K+ transport system NAD-binding subunit